MFQSTPLQLLLFGPNVIHHPRKLLASVGILTLILVLVLALTLALALDLILCNRRYGLHLRTSNCDTPPSVALRSAH